MKKHILPIIALFFSATMFAQNQMPSTTNATAGKLTVTYAVTTPVAILI
jgi:hypothetical protein